jgi:hypothetical protein
LVEPADFPFSVKLKNLTNVAEKPEKKVAFFAVDYIVPG